MESFVIGKNKSNEMSVSTEIDNVGNVHNNNNGDKRNSHAQSPASSKVIKW